MIISKELSAIVDELPKIDQKKLLREVGELINRNGFSAELAEDLVYRKYYGDDYKKKETTHIIHQQEKASPEIEKKLDRILERIDSSEKNLKSLLEQKAGFYIDKGFAEEDAWKMAKAEFLVKIPDTDGLESNLESMKKETEEEGSIDAAADFLSQLGE